MSLEVLNPGFEPMIAKSGMEALRFVMGVAKKRAAQAKPRPTLEELQARRLKRRLKEIAGRRQFERLLNSALLHGGFNG